MCPQHAEIFLVEDDPSVIKSTTEILCGHGHHISLLAATQKEASEIIPLLSNSEINIAVVDLSLTPNGREGIDIIYKIKQLAPLVTTIGRSFCDDIPGADYNCQKKQGITALARLITSI
jgi:DNA-binding NtrC family response regulator